MTIFTNGQPIGQQQNRHVIDYYLFLCEWVWQDDHINTYRDQMLG